MADISTEKRRLAGVFSAVWGVVGVVIILCSACLRLFPHFSEALELNLDAGHWFFLAIWGLFMGYSEGYKGFQKGFSPRVVARAHWLARNPAPVRCLFAPLFCMGFFGATLRRQRATWILTIAIVILVMCVSQISQPWRGLIDFGVVLGIGWGAVAIAAFAAKSLVSGSTGKDPEIAYNLTNPQR